MKNLIRINYFDPLVEGEENPFHISSEDNKKYVALEKIFRKFYNEKTTEEGKTISQYERNLKQLDDKSFTYGEIPFRTMAYIFEYSYSAFGIESQGMFYDLGSGNGSVVFSAVLTQLFRGYIGIEYLEILYKRSLYKYLEFIDDFDRIISDDKINKFLPDYSLEEVNVNSFKKSKITNTEQSKSSHDKTEDKKVDKTPEKKHTKKGAKYVSQSTRSLTRPKLSEPVSEGSETSLNEEKESENVVKIPHIELVNGDFMDRDLSDATFILINSTCFTSQLMNALSQKIQEEVQPGTVVVTITKKLPLLNKKAWSVKPGFKRLMSWGLSTIYLHRREFDSAQRTEESYYTKSKKNSTNSNSNSSSKKKSNSDSENSNEV